MTHARLKKPGDGRSLEQVCTLEPGNPAFHLRAAVLYNREGRGEQAREAARRVRKLDPAQRTARQILSRWTGVTPETGDAR